ncbi:hypothetical protein MTR67_024870 [Solanum verrucosum]|uniref:Uncharacterized protein n=1 Tax=Solanum verrucosum TaxID=315347 RepID=A0AAF0R2G1_SOLVR|nr:hypothetical protein MTR67_024870 [Solanum verrucosum]
MNSMKKIQGLVLKQPIKITFIITNINPKNLILFNSNQLKREL